MCCEPVQPSGPPALLLIACVIDLIQACKLKVVPEPVPYIVRLKVRLNSAALCCIPKEYVIRLELVHVPYIRTLSLLSETKHGAAEI